MTKKDSIDKIENGEFQREYDSQEIIKSGGEMWGKLYDNGGSKHYNLDKEISGSREKFIEWAQKTFSVCPSIESMRRYCKNNS